MGRQRQDSAEADRPAAEIPLPHHQHRAGELPWDLSLSPTGRTAQKPMTVVAVDGNLLRTPADVSATSGSRTSGLCGVAY